MATIAVDFDGTIVTHEYPKIGTELPFATETLKMLIKDHHRINRRHHRLDYLKLPATVDIIKMYN